MSVEWTICIVVSIDKNKCDILSRIGLREIKVMCHSRERVSEQRLRIELNIADNNSYLSFGGQVVYTLK